MGRDRRLESGTRIVATNGYSHNVSSRLRDFPGRRRGRKRFLKIERARDCAHHERGGRAPASYWPRVQVRVRRVALSLSGRACVGRLRSLRNAFGDARPMQRCHRRRVEGIDCPHCLRGPAQTTVSDPAAILTSTPLRQLMPLHGARERPYPSPGCRNDSCCTSDVGDLATHQEIAFHNRQIRRLVLVHVTPATRRV